MDSTREQTVETIANGTCLSLPQIIERLELIEKKVGLTWPPPPYVPAPCLDAREARDTCIATEQIESVISTLKLVAADIERDRSRADFAKSILEAISMSGMHSAVSDATELVIRTPDELACIRKFRKMLADGRDELVGSFLQQVEDARQRSKAV